MNLALLLENSAERVPLRIALRFEGEEVSFQELNRRVNSLARGLTSLGLASGDTCVLMMQSSLEFVTAYYALARMGVAIVPVNFLYKSHELSHIFGTPAPKGFIGMSPFLEEPRKILADLPGLSVRVASGVEPDSGFVPFEKVLETGQDICRDKGGFPVSPVGEEDTAAIIYTSGTTGLPKGAMLTHRNLAEKCHDRGGYAGYLSGGSGHRRPAAVPYLRSDQRSQCLYLPGPDPASFPAVRSRTGFGSHRVGKEHDPVRGAHHAEPSYSCKGWRRAGPVVFAVLRVRRVVVARGNSPQIRESF